MGSRAFRLVLFAALLAAASVAAPPHDASADAIDDSISRMAALDRAGDDAKCAAKVQELKSSNDPRVVAALLEMEKSAGDATACAAIRALTDRKDARSLEWLRSRLDERHRPKGKEGRPEVFKCVLECLAAYRDPGALEPLEAVVKAYLMTDGECATRAIRAYGSVPQKPVVGQLIEWLGQLEQRHGGKSSGGSGGKTRYAPEIQKARDASRDALMKTLASLTDTDFGEHAEWKKWWADNAKTFEFPKLDAAGGQADVTTLAEWTDRRYGYTVKRPEGKGWTFKPADDHFRIQLLKAEDDGTWSAYAGWGIYNTVNSTIKDSDDYADWWINQQFPGQEFERYSAGGEPKVEQRKFAGRDWTVITAKGLGKGKMASWGAMEHRVYFTKTDVRFVYAWVVVKTTAAPEDQTKTWNFVESVVFAAK